MIIMPGLFIEILSFPGVILHEMSHKFFCDYFNVKVANVNYFKISNLSGSVHHEPVLNANHNAIIALAPLAVNSLTFLILAIPYISILAHGTDFVETFSVLDYFLIWIVLSCGLTALPSTTDLDSIADNADKKYLFIKKIVNPLSKFSWVGSLIWMLLLFFFIIASFGRFYFVLLYILNLQSLK